MFLSATPSISAWIFLLVTWNVGTLRKAYRAEAISDNMPGVALLMTQGTRLRQQGDLKYSMQSLKSHFVIHAGYGAGPSTHKPQGWPPFSRVGGFPRQTFRASPSRLRSSKGEACRCNCGRASANSGQLMLTTRSSRRTASKYLAGPKLAGC